MTCPLVVIWWEDSRQPASAWARLSDLTAEPEAVQCASVGWLIHDGDVKQLVPNMGDLGSDDPQASGLIQIPARCVIRVDRIKEPKRPAP